MSATVGTTRLAENVAALITDYVEAVKDALEWEPGRIIYIAPGAQVAADDCCDGQLWGRLVTMQPIPASSGQRGLSSCVVPFYQATLEVGVFRCASVVDDRGVAPDPTTLGAEGLAGIGDMAAMLQAIQCNPATREVLRYTPHGPLGGCVGGMWTFSVRVDNCVTCPPEPEPTP